MPCFCRCLYVCVFAREGAGLSSGGRDREREAAALLGRVRAGPVCLNLSSPGPVGRRAQSVGEWRWHAHAERTKL